MATTLQSVAPLFEPFASPTLTLPNRIAMAPMTRSKSPGGIPGPNVAAYYRRRAEGGVGLIISEGVAIPHPVSSYDPNVPRLAGEPVLAGWRTVTEAVHTAAPESRMFAQLWHIGLQTASGPEPPADQPPAGPMAPIDEVEKIISAFGLASENAQAVGFDGVEIHGAHGYIVDQFFWEKKNTRTDAYGGSIAGRAKFAAEVIREIRRRTGPEFPICLRFSQWKIEDYTAKLARTPGELEQFLAPIVDAGADLLHASTRRFWEPEFPGDDPALTMAGWTKKLSGKPTIAVGSVTLGADVMTSFTSPDAVPVTSLEPLLERLARDEFDLIAIGRSLIANPDWASLVRSGALDRLKAYRPEMTETLY